MSTSSSTSPRKAPTTTTPTSNMSNPSSSPPSPSPRLLTHPQAPSSSTSSASPPSIATSPAAATASPPLQPTLPSPQTARHVSDARAAVVASIGNMLDAELQSRATILHANAAALEKQERDVARATDALRRETQKLKAEADKAARKVKELGNVQNWAEVLERGFLVLEETARLANEGSDGEGSECSCSCSECGRGDDDGSDGEEERRGDGGDGEGGEGGKDDGSGKGAKSVENDAIRKLRTMDLNSMSDASRSLMSILEASSSTGRVKSSGTRTSTG